MLVMVGLPGCRECNDIKNPDCGNYNPCHGQTEANADFRILEQLISLKFETDTILSSCNTKIHFVSKYDADTFIWTLGSETIYEKEFLRSCGWPSDEWITVQLVAIKSAYKNPCLPESKLRDTVNKSFFVISTNNPGYPMRGVFLGSNIDTPKDTFRVSISNTYPYLEGLPKGLTVTNPIFSPGVQLGYGAVAGGKAIEFNPTSGPRYTLSCMGYFYFSNGRMTINYQYDENALIRYYPNSCIRKLKWGRQVVGVSENVLQEMSSFALRR
jgi:hypothetical protein